MICGPFGSREEDNFNFMENPVTLVFRGLVARLSALAFILARSSSLVGRLLDGFLPKALCCCGAVDLWGL
jgi:hypothetical protein